jgi:nucleoside-diphosphate-sugar epimerase
MECNLVTGAGGMVGSHLVEHLRAAGGAEVVGTSLGACAALALDVRDAGAVRALIAARRPATIYHLAAQSLPTRSWIDPVETMQSNVIGTVNMFEAVREVRATLDAAYDPMLVIACSSAEYGASLVPERLPVDEEAPLLPLHPYGVSKVAQDLLAFQYWRNERIRCIRARIFNTTGPRKRDDVVSDFAARFAAIARGGGGGALRVGNLQTRRAILDVRDLIAALTLLAQRGAPGEAYNICAPTAGRIGDLVPIFASLAGITPALAPDPALFRPSDEPVILGRTDKLQAATGWRASIPLQETLRAVLAYEMARPAA